MGLPIVLNTLAICSASCSHQCLVAQNVSTEWPFIKVSRHNCTTWSGSSYRPNKFYYL